MNKYNEWYEGYLDIDGMTLTITAAMSEPYDIDQLTENYHNILVEIPAVNTTLADRILRAISKEYEDTQK